MPMRSSFRSEEGFTLAETLVAMLIFLVAVCVLWELMLRTDAGFALAGSMGSTAARAEQIDRSIRKMAGAVSIPFWAGDAQFSISGSSTSIPYASGKKDTNVSLSYEGATLTLIDGTSITKFAGIESFDLKPIVDGSSSVIGITATYTIHKKDFSTRALFRSVSLISGKNG
jgi:hypothetical protein